MLTLFELQSFAGNQCTHRKTARNPFCKRHNIRFYLRVLDSEPFARPPHSALHFINDHECTGGVAHFPDPRQEAVGRNNDTCLTLYWFNNYPSGIVVNCFFQPLEIAIFDERAGYAQRFKRFAYCWFVRNGK